MKKLFLLPLLLLVLPALTLTDIINIPATHQFFQSDGAKVNRINDRLLVGEATVYTGGNTIFPDNDWLSQFYGDTPYAQFVSLFDGSSPAAKMPIPQIGILAGVQSLNAPSGATPRALEFSAFNNPRAGNNPSVWGMYGEAHHFNGGAWTTAIEIDTIAHDAAATGWTPHSSPGAPAIGQAIACGGGVMTSKVCTVAMYIGANPMPFAHGIMFMGESIAPLSAGGTIGAIMMPGDYRIEWFSHQDLVANITADENGNLIINTNSRVYINGRELWCGQGATVRC